jgi:hypothetical protein
VSVLAQRHVSIAVATAVLLGTLVSLAIHLAYWNAGAFGDEGSFCTLGQELLHGHVPYRDYFNEKMPLQYVWTAAVMGLSTSGIAGARLAAGICLAAVFALFAYQLRSRSLTGAVPPLLLAAVICVGMRGYNNTAESSLALLYGVAAILIVRQGRVPGQGNAVALGLIHGLAIGFRQTGVACAIVVLASPWIAGRRIAFLTGVFAALIGWVGLLYAVGVQPSQLLSALYFPAGSAETVQYFRGVVSGGWVWVLAWVALIAGATWANPDRWRAAWTCAWLFALALPFFARMDGFRLWPSTAAATLMLLPVVMHQKKTAQALWMIAAGVALMFRLGKAESFDRDSEIASYLLHHTRAQDSIWVAPWRPNVYCLSARESATRFYFILPWTAQARVKAEIMLDLARNKPEFIVDVSGGPYSLTDMLPPLRELLAANYHAPVKTTAALYYRRRHDMASQ